MKTTKRNPKWWQLYLSFPLLIALFVMDSRLKISTGGHQAVQIGMLLLVYGLIHLWLKANAQALSAMDREKLQGRVQVIQIPILQIHEADDEKYPIFQLPASEIKGILSDPVETGYMDAKSLPVENVPHQSIREK